MKKTIQITIDDSFLQRVNRATQALGITRSVFIRKALELALRELAIDEMEQKHSSGYQRYPVIPGEFDVWETEP